jgi:hypothetical protein
MRLLLLLPCLSLLACSDKGEDSAAAAPSTDDGGDGASDDGTDGGSGDGGTDEGTDGTEGGDEGSETGDDGTDDPLSGSWTFDGPAGTDTVTISATEDAAGLRSYALTTTHPLRDGHPGERTVTELAGDPLLRSGVLLTDALFAMAVDDARLNAVSEISDYAFEGPVACDCYKTGELWNWVWTRDIAYATELGLAWLDPQRAANSLLFKLSDEKDGEGGLQIVQDTGTGGSWPVSSDRVAWARGAMAVLRYADIPELREAAIEAMANTAATDRRFVFDATDGLYRGETSFLDWREQSYARWVEQNPVHIAMSKSLSTNLDHLFLLRSLEELTGEEQGADALATAIDAAFWDGTTYRSYIPTTLDPTAAERQDLLATSLAVMDLGTHPEALEAYPFGPYGPPVLWPQQQVTPIYHNRGIWPFVTAYSVIAAKGADNGAVVEAGLDSLVRGAALNLSHMENFELATGANWLDDGDYSGPVVNSRRQLWSVAGFLGAVAHGVFGLEGEDGVLSADPALPDGDWFTEGATLTIGDFTATLGGEGLGAGAVTTFETDDWQDLFGARTARVSMEGAGDEITLEFSGESGATFDVFRDGVLMESGASSPWTDTTSTTACYTVVSRLKLPGQPTDPLCWWGDGYVRIQSILPSDFTSSGGSWSTDHGREHYGSWGAPDHTITASFTANNTGEHLLQLAYGNGAGPIDTGITAAVKWLEVHDSTAALVAEGPVVMPQLGDWDRWADSSFVRATLDAGQTYTLTISDGWNMSHLSHYERYVAGRGGGAGPSNDVNIAEIKVLFMR